MAITVEAFEQLDPQNLRDIEDFLVEFISSVEPNLDLNPSSVLFQFIVRLSAIYHGLNQQDVDNVLKSNSIKQVTEDPTLADDTVVDNLLSNYFITRQTGTIAAGQIRIILNKNILTPITDNTEFVANGVTYKPTRSFTGVKTAAEIVSADSDRLILPVGNNQYAFTIDVAATTAGSNGNVSKNTQFTYSSLQSHIVGAVAVSDFDGGSDTETNTQLIQRLNEGISTKNLASRISVKAMITNQFPSVKDVSVIGAGDPEMYRDKNNAFGMSSFGKADIYVRTRPQLLTTTLTKTATLVDPTNGIWALNFTRDEIPGAYYITAVRPLNSYQAQPLTITQITRTADTTDIAGLDFTPTLFNNHHVFTRYQTLSVFFIDKTNANLYTSLDYTVEVISMPQLAEINDYVLDRSRRHPGGDYLVRATVPCVVSAGINIVRGPGDPEIDTEAIKTKVADVINSVDYLQGRLSADQIIAAVRELIPARSRIKFPLDLRGVIYTPEPIVYPTVKAMDGRMWLFDLNELKIPNRPDIGVTSRTTSFFTNPMLIQVDVEASDAVIV